MTVSRTDGHNVQPVVDIALAILILSHSHHGTFGFQAYGMMIGSCDDHFGQFVRPTAERRKSQPVFLPPGEVCGSRGIPMLLPSKQHLLQRTCRELKSLLHIGMPENIIMINILVLLPELLQRFTFHI